MWSVEGGESGEGGEWGGGGKEGETEEESGMRVRRAKACLKNSSSHEKSCHLPQKSPRFPRDS